MWPFSFNRCASIIVREGENPSRELAACCRVEVINGGRGERFTSVCLMEIILHALFLRATSRIRSTSFSSLGSSSHVSVSSLFFFVLNVPCMVQYCSGLK